MAALQRFRLAHELVRSIYGTWGDLCQTVPLIRPSIIQKTMTV